MKQKRIFEESERTYGPDRIAGTMRTRGHKASYGKVKLDMEREGLHS
jgi:hypothetical protein